MDSIAVFRTGLNRTESSFDGLAAPRKTEIDPAAASRLIGRTATRALYYELALAPKPGLVSMADSGSHSDMNADTFMRSLFALRSYFPAIALAGALQAEFVQLQQLGMKAECDMLIATGGINTHRGAIFALGLLAACAGYVLASGDRVDADTLRTVLLKQWGTALQERIAIAAGRPALTHGEKAARAYGLKSAGEQAAAGFPVLFEITLPALRWARARTSCSERPLIQALFATMAELDDTNLACRGGLAGLEFARRQAKTYLAAGGVFQPNWREAALDVHRVFVSKGLSPGGAADLLSCAWFVDSLERGDP